MIEMISWDTFFEKHGWYDLVEKHEHYTHDDEIPEQLYAQMMGWA